MSFLIASRVAMVTNKEHLAVRCDSRLTHAGRLIMQIGCLKLSAV